MSGNATLHLAVVLGGTGAGSVVSTPPGIDCPGACAVDLQSANATLVATPDSESMVASWSACAGHGTSCTVALGGETTVDVDFTLAHLCVDAVHGKDTASGRCGVEPLRTITAAVAHVPERGTISVGPGTYDAGHGEVFPIRFPKIVSIIGDEAHKGGGTAPVVVDGEGVAVAASNTRATFVLGALSTLAGFRIQAPPVLGVSKVLMDGPTQVTIRNNDLDSGGDPIDAIALFDEVNATIVGNVITNGRYGIAGTYAKGKIEDNVISGNERGVFLDGATNGLDLGGGAFGSAGGNILRCNTGADVWTGLVNTAVSARDNQWDHVPPAVETTCNVDGADFCGKTVPDLRDAVLAPTPCP